MNILNPTDIVNELFGNIWLFLAFASIIFFGIASNKKFNMQLTMVIYIFILFCFAILFEGWQTWLPFIIVIVGYFGGMAFARFMKKD